MSEQIRLIQYIDDVTELRFLSEAVRPQKRIVEEEAQVEAKMLSRLPIRRLAPRKLTLTTSNIKSLHYLQNLGSLRGSMDFGPSKRYSTIGIVSGSGSASVIGSVNNCDFNKSVSQLK